MYFCTGSSYAKRHRKKVCNSTNLNCFEFILISNRSRYRSIQPNKGDGKIAFHDYRWQQALIFTGAINMYSRNLSTLLYSFEEEKTKQSYRTSLKLQSMNKNGEPSTVQHILRATERQSPLCVVSNAQRNIAGNYKQLFPH